MMRWPTGSYHWPSPASPSSAFVIRLWCSLLNKDPLLGLRRCQVDGADCGGPLVALSQGQDDHWVDCSNQVQDQGVSHRENSIYRYDVNILGHLCLHRSNVGDTTQIVMELWRTILQPTSNHRYVSLSVSEYLCHCLPGKQACRKW